MWKNPSSKDTTRYTQFGGKRGSQVRLSNTSVNYTQSSMFSSRPNGGSDSSNDMALNSTQSGVPNSSGSPVSFLETCCTQYAMNNGGGYPKSSKTAQPTARNYITDNSAGVPHRSQIYRSSSTTAYITAQSQVYTVKVEGINWKDFVVLPNLECLTEDMTIEVLLPRLIFLPNQVCTVEVGMKWKDQLI